MSPQQSEVELFCPPSLKLLGTLGGRLPSQRNHKHATRGVIKAMKDIEAMTEPWLVGIDAGTGV